MIKILITGPGAYIEESKDLPEVGRSYHLEDATDGTLAQNKLFHALLAEWETSCLHTFEDDLKRQVKYKYGEGLNEYIYWNGEKWVIVKKKEEIPADIRKDRSRCFGHLKSWSDYTLKERKKCIDKLIRAMLRSGVCSKQFDLILEGIGWTE